MVGYGASRLTHPQSELLAARIGLQLVDDVGDRFENRVLVKFRFLVRAQLPRHCNDLRAIEMQPLAPVSEFVPYHPH